jgi:phage tail tape-measure protein
MVSIHRLSAIALLLALLAGCGTQEPGRATGSAATGAATGATVGLLGGPVGVVVGALIGGGAGAATGAAVGPNHINLGPPPWSNEAN